MKFTSLAASILSVSVVFIVLCTAAVALRIQARRARSLPLKGDDYTIIAALVMIPIPLCGCLLLSLSDCKCSSLRERNMGRGQKRIRKTTVCSDEG